MKQLFKVETNKYENYYVFASSYDEAARKVENHYISEKLKKEEEKENSIFDSDGSLNPFYGTKDEESIEIRGIEKVKGNVIF